MKKRNESSGDVTVSSRIMGLLGRRKVDPTSEAMKAFKPGFIEGGYVFDLEAYRPNDVEAVLPHDEMLDALQSQIVIHGEPFALPAHLRQSERFMRPTGDLREYKQFGGRIARQPGLTPDEQQRLIDVLERMLK